MRMLATLSIYLSVCLSVCLLHQSTIVLLYVYMMIIYCIQLAGLEVTK
jgi:hypothetical protein